MRKLLFIILVLILLLDIGLAILAFNQHSLKKRIVHLEAELEAIGIDQVEIEHRLSTSEIIYHDLLEEVFGDDGYIYPVEKK